MLNPLSLLAPTGRVSVPLRRRLARLRRWWWIAAVGLAAAAAWGVDDARRDAAADRAAWGTTVDVLVAEVDHAPGDPIAGEVRAVPTVLVPDRAASPGDLVAGDAPPVVARQRIVAGEVIVAHDLSAAGVLARVPDGWRAVTVAEYRRSAASVGDRVDVVADGLVLADDVVVVAVTPDERLVTLAVPADDAPVVATADLLQPVALAVRR